MNKKIEDILFYAGTSVRPSKKDLEKILEEIPVTNYKNYRYSNVMGIRLALPLGVIALGLIAYLAFGTAKNIQTPPTVTTLPAHVTKQNVDSSLNQVDQNIGKSINDMDQELQELDQETNDSNQDNLNDL